MEPVVIISIAIVVNLIAFSQYFTFKTQFEDKKVVYMYFVLSFSLAAIALLDSFMYIAFNSKMCFILYAIEKFLKVVVMCSIVMLTSGMVDVKTKIVSAFISFITYGAVALYLVDAIVQGGQLESSLFGVYCMPHIPWHKALYYIYYMIYVIALIVLVAYKGMLTVRRSEQHDLVLFITVYILSAIGFVGELSIVTFGVSYFPLVLVLNTFAMIVMRYLLVYHESIQVRPDKFMLELDPGRTDIALVVDDRLSIIYQNKRAEVFSQIVHDEFLGRKLTDVFEFSDSALEQIGLNPDNIPFGINAIYPVNNRNVNLVIHHRVDNYGEVIATGIFVYNIEEIDEVDSKVIAPADEEDNNMIENALMITKNARALLVDEDVVFLNVFSRLLEQYGIRVTRATSGAEALSVVEESVYDVIFIAYEMKHLNGVQTAKQIRCMRGEYYVKVPIVFTTVEDINEVFGEFLEAGFNDYLVKPITKKALNSVLTRWLWQHFTDSSVYDVEQESAFEPQYYEMNNLLESAIYMLDNKKYDKFSYCINGIKHASNILGMTDLSEVASTLEEAVMFEDEEQIDIYFDRLTNIIREAVTINS